MYIKNIKIGSFSLLLLSFLFSVSSCSDDFETQEIEDNNEPPVITSVSEAREDVPVNQGVLENTYIIRGENLATLTAIYFNGVRAGFNPALTTNELTFVTIPETAPYVGQDNILRLENLSGSTEYDFSLLTITDFTESTTEDGVNTVTLMGGDFSDTSTVLFTSGTEEDGNLVEREAEILSVNETEVTVAVPSGVEQAFIHLVTSRGAIAQSESYGFSYPIFIDELNEDVNFDGSWNGSQDPQATEQALGEFSIKRTYSQYGGFQLTFTEPIATDDYSALLMKVYGGPNASIIRISFNGLNNDDIGKRITIEEGQWNTFSLSLNDAEFWGGGAPQAQIETMVIQELSANGDVTEWVYYFDDMGFIE
jgi:hypothetical protein